MVSRSSNADCLNDHHFKGDFDAVAAKNFAKVADEILLVQKPDGLVDDFFEPLFCAFDMTREIRQRAHEGSALAPTTAPGRLYADLNYPVDDNEGNDDGDSSDGYDNPYPEGLSDVGTLVAYDTPKYVLFDDQNGSKTGPAEDKDQFQSKRWFLEFARVQIGSKWYRCSKLEPWRNHIFLERKNGEWQAKLPSILDTTNDGL